MSDAANAARAIDALRRGWPVCINGHVTLLAIETADSASLPTFDPDSKADILISAGRAFTLKLANQIEAAVPDAPVLVARRSWLGLPEATALADPAMDLATPMKGPFEAIHCETPDAARAALTKPSRRSRIHRFRTAPSGPPVAMVMRSSTTDTNLLAAPVMKALMAAELSAMAPIPWQSMPS